MLQPIHKLFSQLSRLASFFTASSWPEGDSGHRTTSRPRSINGLGDVPSKTNAIRLLRQSAIVATSAKVAPVSLGSGSPNFAALNPIKVSAEAAVGDSDESLDGPCALGGGPISVAASSCVLTPARRSSKARAALSRLSITK